MDCWSQPEEHSQCKSKKKRRKGKGFCNEVRGQPRNRNSVHGSYSDTNTKYYPPLKGEKGEGYVLGGTSTDQTLTPMHTCQTKELISSVCGGANVALQSPWTSHQKDVSLQARLAEANTSLEELLVRVVACSLSYNVCQYVPALNASLHSWMCP